MAVTAELSAATASRLAMLRRTAQSVTLRYATTVPRSTWNRGRRLTVNYNEILECISDTELRIWGLEQKLEYEQEQLAELEATRSNWNSKETE